MILVYVFLVILILCYLLVGWKKGFRSLGIFIVKILLLCIYLFVVVVLFLFMLVFLFEELIGLYRVGMKLYYWVDY